MSANVSWSVPGGPNEADGRQEGAGPASPAGREQLPGRGEHNKAVYRVTAADDTSPASLQPPTARTWAQLEVPSAFRDAVEQELKADEEVLWLGRPSRNREVHPSNAWLPIAGGGMIVFGLG